jgi:hypothetical protein
MAYITSCYSSLKYNDIVAKSLAGNDLEAEYFDEHSKESGDIVVSRLQSETANIKTEDESLVIGWQPRVDAEPIKEVQLSDTVINPPQNQF